MKKHIMIFIAILVFAVLHMPAESEFSYVSLVAAGTDVNVRAEARVDGKVFTHSNPAFVPENHEEFIVNESYKNSFRLLTSMMKRAEESVTPSEYKAIEEETHKMITGMANYLMTEYGIAKQRAYDLAYAERGRDLRMDWLTKNADSVQGFYGHSEYAAITMTIEKTEEKGKYVVEISLGLNEEPYRISFKRNEFQLCRLRLCNGRQRGVRRV